MKSEKSRLEMEQSQEGGQIAANFIPENPAARVKLTMAIASSLLFSLKEPPSKEKPLYINGANDTAKYLWTAVMVFSQRQSAVKFDHTAIKTRFYYEDEINKSWYIPGFFSKNSLYEKEFKHHLTDDMLIITKFPKAYDGVPDEFTTIEEQGFYIENKLKELKKEEIRRQEELKIKSETPEQKEARKQEELKKEEEKREKIRKQEELKKEEEAKREKIRKQEELKRQAEAQTIKNNYNQWVCIVTCMEDVAKTTSSIILAIDKLDIDVNFQNADGDTFLSFAIYARRDDIAEYLLKHKKANPFLKTKKDISAADMVSKNSHLWTIINELREEFDCFSTPNIILYDMLENPGANLFKIQSLLKHDKIDFNFQNPLNGYTFLMLSVVAQYDSVTEYLLHLGADPLIRSDKGFIASDFASRSSAVYPLLKQKETEAKRQILPLKNRISLKLHDAAVLLNTKLTQIDEYLSEGADINFQNTEGETALILAVDAQNDRVAEYLLKNMANPFIKNKYQRKARDLTSTTSSIHQIIKGYELLHATSEDNLSTIKSLLQNDRYLIDFQNSDGYTAILIAVEQKSLAIVEYLLSKKPNLTMVRNDGQGIFELVNNDLIYALLIKADESLLDEIPSEQPAHFDDAVSDYGFFTQKSVDVNNSKGSRLKMNNFNHIN